MHTTGKLYHMANMPTNLLAENGMRLFRCDFDGDFDSPEANANARRLVALWNACQGISTESLEADCVRKLVEAARTAETFFDAYEAFFASQGIEWKSQLRSLLAEALKPFAP